MVLPAKTRELHNHHFDSTIWNDFAFRPDDIIISTYAKSGTTWMQQIIGQMLFNGDPELEVAEMSPWLDLRVPPKDVKLPAVEAQTHRRFLKTHLPVDALLFSPEAKYIYIGRDGRDLDEVWGPRPIAYLSISVPEYPNLFMLNGPNGPVGNFSLIEIAELQIAYILQLVGKLERGECREICSTRDATDAFDAARVEAAKNTVWSTGCQSWYLDDRGIPATWPWTFDRFCEEMAAPRWEAYDQR